MKQSKQNLCVTGRRGGIVRGRERGGKKLREDTHERKSQGGRRVGKKRVVKRGRGGEGKYLTEEMKKENK